MKDFIISTNIKVYPIGMASEADKKLIQQAQAIAMKAYAPYSTYHVGAAVLLENGEIITGNNQENAAYPSGLCAERTAMFYTNANHPDTPVLTIAVCAYHNGSFTPTVCTPCGSCRQALLETENRFGVDIRILMCSATEVYEADSVKSLLPLHFS